MRVTPVAPVYPVSKFNRHREQAVYTPKPKEKIVQYITHNQDDLIRSSGTCLQGCITDTSYITLVSTFGEPMKDGFDNYKSDAEWLVQFDDGTVATIYNWKNGKNYCGDEGTPTTQIRDWHIGGYEGDAVDRVKQALRSICKETA